MSQSLPADIAARLDLLERLVADQSTSPQSVAAQRLEWEKKLRDKSRFQGLGEAVPNPNLHAHLKYPGYRFHAVEGLMVVNNPQEDEQAKAEGWCESPTEAVALTDPPTPRSHHKKGAAA